MNDSFEKLEKDLENFESESPYKTVDILKEQIEDMLEDGFSEERVWKACKLDMQKFDIEIEKNSLVIDRIEMLLTNRIGHFKSKEICEKFQKICIQRIDDYKTCKELVRNFKKRYCKSILTTTPSNDKHKELDKPILNNHIKWIGNRELLVKLINSLKQEYFIEAQETEDIADLILNRTTDKQQVNWLKKKSLLAYLIESLNEVLISPDNIWADTAPYFLWKGETVTREQLSSSADQYKNNKNMKPLNHEVIDKIIERIKNIDHH